MSLSEVEAEAFESAVGLLRAAKKVVVFSGAGLSAESGIATFRDPGGLWEQFPLERFGTIGGLVRTLVCDPEEMRRFALVALETLIAAEPNAAHGAIARLEAFKSVVVVTQNVDGLHQRAGSSVVHELHGSIYRLRNMAGTYREPISREQLVDVVERLRGPLERCWRRRALLRALRPLLGRRPGVGRMRPDVVFFGEELPAETWKAAKEAAGSCEAMLVVGTSAVVYPAAWLPEFAKQHGASVVAVTTDREFSRPWADVVLVGQAGQVLPRLVEHIAGAND